MNNRTKVVANIPSKNEEKALFGFLNWQQFWIIGAGVILGLFAFLISKFILGFFFSFLIKWFVSLIIWIITVLPFVYISIRQIYSDNDHSVALYPFYVYQQIKKHEEENSGIYINYHCNHPIINREHAVHIDNETTIIDEEDLKQY